MDFLDAFRRAVRVYGSETAIVTGDGRSFTYAEFDRRSTALANALADRVGASPCAVVARNSPIAVEAMVVGHKRGVPTVQLPFREPPAELVELADIAGAGAILFDDANADTAAEMLDRGNFDLAVHAGSESVDAGGVVSYDDLLADASTETVVPADGKTQVFFTSGTTSRPKAVAFDSHQLWLGAYQVAIEHGIDATDVAIVTTPWYHMVTSDAWLYPHWLAGATTVLRSGFDPAGVLQHVEAHDATGLLAVPTQLDAMCAVQAGADDGYDTGSLRYIRTGGAIVPEELIERSAAHLTEGVYNTYGLTEAGPNLTFAPPRAQADHPGTVGKESFSWEVRVVETVGLDERPDPEATVDAGDRGEILARGPALPDGYIDNPAADERTFLGEWLRTRDVARVDEDGYLYVVDRVDNMFISGGENIYPREVENTLTDHDAVEEALVFGMDDDRWGQRVTAVVVTEDAVDVDDLDEYCRDHDLLADFKRPREYALRTDPLPRTDTGTVQRENVIEEHFG